MLPIPHNAEAEAGVLGCCLLDQSAIAEASAAGLKPDHFHLLANREIWKAITSLADAGQPVDTITLMARLKERSLVEGVGGLAYLSGLPDTVPSAANLDYYLQLVQEAWYAREVMQRCSRLAHAAAENKSGLEELTATVETEIYSLRGLRQGRDDRKASFHRIVEQLEQAYNKQAHPGLATGFRRIDRLLGGLRAGEVVVLAARPSMGKSALALNIVEHVASTQGAAGYFSLEMSEDALNMRSLGSFSGVNMQAAMRGDLTEADIRGLVATTGKVSKLPIHIRDRSDLTIAELRSEGRRLVREHKAVLIVVDYLQLLVGSRRSRDRREEVGEVSRGVKSMARELAVPVIALSQLNREIDRDSFRRPRLADLREAGDIEQDADIVCFIWEPELGQVQFSVSKNRSGPLGDVPMDFDRPVTRFKERSHFEGQKLPARSGQVG